MDRSVDQTGKPEMLLGALFAPRRRNQVSQKAAGSSCQAVEFLYACRVCGSSFQLTPQQASAQLAHAGGGDDVMNHFECESCRRHEVAWAKIRGWVCVHALVATQRALPLFDPTEFVAIADAEPCAEWEDEGAAERTLLALEARHMPHVEVERLQTERSEFGVLAANVATLPGDLLARVLAFAYDGAGEVFAPTFAPPTNAAMQGLFHEEEPTQRRRKCTQLLLGQGSCLHGRVVPGPRRTKSLACWYCPKTFPFDSGAAELEEHAEAEHASDITNWIRKMRKTKARMRRDWYQASGSGQTARIAEMARLSSKNLQVKTR